MGGWSPAPGINVHRLRRHRHFGGAQPRPGWHLLDPRRDQQRKPAGDSAPTLAFDDAGNISGSAGCNTYTAIAAFDDNSIAFGPLATTQMACPVVTGLQEAAFLQAMNDVQTYAIDSQGHLVLEDGVVLIFEAD